MLSKMKPKLNDNQAIKYQLEKDYLSKLLTYFDKTTVYNDCERKQAQQIEFKKVYNGKFVSGLTGLVDKDLGKFMAGIKGGTDDEQFQNFVIGLHHSNTLKDYVLGKFKEWREVSVDAV